MIPSLELHSARRFVASAVIMIVALGSGGARADEPVAAPLVSPQQATIPGEPAPEPTGSDPAAAPLSQDASPTPAQDTATSPPADLLPELEDLPVPAPTAAAPHKPGFNIRDVLLQPMVATLPATLVILGIGGTGLTVVSSAALAALSWGVAILSYGPITSGICTAPLSFINPLLSAFLQGLLSIAVCGSPMALTFGITPLLAISSVAAWMPLPLVEHVNWLSVMRHDASKRGTWKALLTAGLLGPVLPLAVLSAAIAVHVVVAAGPGMFALAGFSSSNIEPRYALPYSLACMSVTWCAFLPIVSIPLSLLQLPASLLSVVVRNTVYTLVARFLPDNNTSASPSNTNVDLKRAKE